MVRKSNLLVNSHKHFAVFFLVSTFCLIASPRLFISIQKFVSYVLIFLVIPSLVNYLYQKHGAKYFRHLIYLSVWILCIGFAFMAINEEVAFSHHGRFRGILGNPNGLGMFCAFTFMFFEILYDKMPGFCTRKERIFIRGVILLALTLSGSRSSLICISIFFTFQYLVRYSNFLSFILLIVIMVTNEYIIEIMMGTIIELGFQEFFRLDTISFGSGRTVAWKFAWKEIQKNFFKVSGDIKVRMCCLSVFSQ